MKHTLLLFAQLGISTLRRKGAASIKLALGLPTNGRDSGLVSHAELSKYPNVLSVSTAITTHGGKLKTLTKAFLLSILVLAVCPGTGVAAPVLYNTNFAASLGPSGTGSFLFDSVTGNLSNFVWDFGSGIVGSTSYDTSIVFGDTSGRFVFEILSETDVHSGANCINLACSRIQSFSGLGPNGAPFFQILGTSAPGSSNYSFRQSFDNAVPPLAEGTITMSPAGVPETTPILLVGGSLAGILLVARNRRRLRLPA